MNQELETAMRELEQPDGRTAPPSVAAETAPAGAAPSPLEQLKQNYDALIGQATRLMTSGDAARARADRLEKELRVTADWLPRLVEAFEPSQKLRETLANDPRGPIVASLEFIERQIDEHRGALITAMSACSNIYTAAQRALTKAGA